MSRFHTPLSRARGMGAAHHGASQWIGERVTSIALAPLSLWVVFAGLRLAGRDYHSAMAWLAQPLNASLACLTAVVGFIHMHAGLRVIVEDYIHTPLSKSLILLANLFVCGLFAALALISILKIALTGGY
jgi:succinate dehydrogenase / fumarate reductase membrane anchor subunit